MRIWKAMENFCLKKRSVDPRRTRSVFPFNGNKYFLPNGEKPESSKFTDFRDILYLSRCRARGKVVINGFCTL